ncbi:hypothetical protein NP233_g4184 [Leucocoprinus birnbaumii]|uniref:Uncharacterized protein n=1 Tax=Leucocoprinus birnbaumii TaxID=56174 RepID=A0AAD5VXQ3_9AGAR|nr:hypothetical protein NP233_g4184 [Leucocoprinus birnbaumii]
MVLWTQIDETDSSVFTFENSRNGDWFHVSDNQDFGGTSMQTWSIQTAVRVNFRGKAIQLFGTIDQGINLTASVDNGLPDTLFQFIDTKIYRQQIYSSPQLDYGDHTLVVTQLFDHFPLIVDYAQVDEEAPSPAALVTTTSSLAEPQTPITKAAESPSPPTTSQNQGSDTSGTGAPNPTSLNSSTTSHVSSTAIIAAPASISSQSTSSSASSIPSSGSTGGPGAIPASFTHHSALSAGSIAGIAIAATTIVGIIILLIWFLSSTRTKEDQEMLEEDLKTSAWGPTSEKARLRAYHNFDHSPQGVTSDREISSTHEPGSPTMIAQASSTYATQTEEAASSGLPQSQTSKGIHSQDSVGISNDTLASQYPTHADTTTTTLSVPASGWYFLQQGLPFEVNGQNVTAQGSLALTGGTIGSSNPSYTLLESGHGRGALTGMSDPDLPPYPGSANLNSGPQPSPGRLVV